MVEMPFSPEKLEMYTLHKSLGLTAFALTLMRLLWRFRVRKPGHLETHKKWERHLSGIVHAILYLSLLGLPLSGWLMSSAGQFPVSYFGLFSVPDIMAADQNAFKALRVAHTFMGYVLVCSVLLHFMGTIKHHYIDKDHTLSRMLTPNNIFTRSWVYTAIFVSMMVTTLIWAGVHEYSQPQSSQSTSSRVKIETAPTEAGVDALPSLEQTRWSLLPEQSEITFSTSVYGTPFTGRFEKFSGEIQFDPESLETSEVRVTVSLSSAVSGSQERDTTIQNAIWFDSESFPESRFIAKEFKKVDLNQYVAQGSLTIKGVQNPLEFIFDYQETQTDQGESVATATGEFVINRQDFMVGTGEWQSDETVASDVKVTVSLTARRN